MKNDAALTNDARKLASKAVRFLQELADEHLSTNNHSRVRQLMVHFDRLCDENEALRKALGDAQCKAELATKILNGEGPVMDKIAEGFSVIARHCAAALANTDTERKG